jgi:hypothetical protein
MNWVLKTALGLTIVVGSFAVTLFTLDYIERGPSLPTTDLVAYWSFDGSGEDTRIEDKSDKANHATLTGASPAPANTPGKIGRAQAFDGTRTLVMRSAMQPSITPELSVSLWVNVAANRGGNRGLASGQNAGSDFREGFNIDLCGPSSPSFNCLNVEAAGISGSWNARTSQTPFGEWVHVAVVIGSGRNGVKVYINGTLEGQKDRVSTNMAIGNFRVGARYFDGSTSGHLFEGTLDEVRIYARPLSAQEVLQLYRAGG